MLSPNRWLWIGSIALVLSFVLPYSDARGGDDWEWVWEGWDNATYASLFSRLLAPTLALIVLAFVRPLRSPRRGVALAILAALFAAWHYVSYITPINLSVSFGVPDVGITSGEKLAAYLFFGLAAVIAGQALPTRLLLMCGGLWLLTALAIPNNSRPVGLAFFKADWREVWPALCCMATIGSIGLSAVFGMKRITRWLIVGLGIAGPILFVYQGVHFNSKLDTLYLITLTVRGVCLYYGLLMLLASGLVASRSPATS